MENMAGMESTAKMISENSITSKTTNKGVIYQAFPLRTKKRFPSPRVSTLKIFEARRTAG